MKLKNFIKIFYIFIIFLLFNKNIVANQIYFFYSIENLYSQKTASNGSKWIMPNPLFINRSNCVELLCSTGSGSELYYPVKESIFTLGWRIKKQNSQYAFLISYGESDKQQGAYDIDFYTYPFTKQRLYGFTDLFVRKDTIYVWTHYQIFIDSISYIQQRYYKIEFSYEKNLNSKFDFIMKAKMERTKDTLFNSYSRLFPVFTIGNDHFFSNDYYILGLGIAYNFLRLENFEVQFSGSLLLGILHFDFYHPNRYLEFVGDNIGNGYNVFLNFRIKERFVASISKENFFTLTPYYAKGTRVRKYSVSEIPQILLTGLQGPDVQIHRSNFKWSLSYEHPF